ncbi:glycine zipper 2TM domain-containing protein [Caminibacter sp.]
MKKIFLAFGIGAAIFFSGCTKLYNSNEVSLNQVNTVLSYETGTVQDVKHVVIKDNGSGVFVGAYTGTVLGSMFGNGKGNLLSTLIGGLTGAFVGYEADKANAEELFIKLDNGKNIVVIVKGVKIQKGDRVRIIMEGNKIVRVEEI